MTNRINRKIERTPDQEAEIKYIRAMSLTKEGRAELQRTGSVRDGEGTFVGLMRLIGALGRRRQELGLAEAEIAERMGIETSELTRLEGFQVINPTAWTLLRWAEALDCRIGLDVQPIGKEEPAAAAG